MKVTLIRPPVYSIGLMGAQIVPVLGIAYIAAVIREAGHEVDIVDMCGEDIDRTELIQGKYVQYGMSFTSLRKRLSSSDVVCFTSMFSQDWPFHRKLIQYVRGLLPESTLVAGGEHISALPEYCLRDCPELDMCVTGEGEAAMIKMLEVLQSGESLEKVPSLVYRDSDGKNFLKNKMMGRIRSVDDLPRPAWDLMPMENYLSRGLTYHIKRGRTIPMVATRGCPYKCTFCSNPNMWGNAWTPRDPKLVADEMEYYIQKYQAENFVFSDLTAVVGKRYIVQLCEEIIQRNLNITWQLPTLRTEAVDRSVLELMYKAGCRDLDFAIESGSKKVLAAVKKQNDPDRIFSLIKEGLDVGMNMSANIVIGFPQERFKDFFKTYWLVLKLAVSGQQELNVFPFIPYPGSKLFNEYCEQNKIILSDKYFLDLFAYADLSKPTSWSPHFGPRTLSFMRFILLSHFYTVMLLSHPIRIFSMVNNVIKGKTVTKLEGVLRRVFKNVKASFHRKDNPRNKNYAEQDQIVERESQLASK